LQFCKRILVIDDQYTMRKSFVLALEETEYQVDMAESGEKGIEMEKEGNKRPMSITGLISALRSENRPNPPCLSQGY
jgi:DNA-binding response OmpR family regulator